jgi:hypothetical protein
MLYRDNKGTNCYVHILVADTFIPNPENKPTVNHKDGNKTRNVVSNLEWSTWSENHMHKTRVLGRGRGSGHSHAKLTDNEVIFIRYDKRPRKVIARDFGVSISTVDSIVNRKTWKHLV